MKNKHYSNIFDVTKDFPEFKIVEHKDYEHRDYEWLCQTLTPIKIIVKQKKLKIYWKYCIEYKNVLFEGVCIDTTGKINSNIEALTTKYTSDNLNTFKNYVDMFKSNLYQAMKGDNI